MEISGYNSVEKISQNNRASEIDKRREARERDDAKRADDNRDRITISEEARDRAVQNKENAG